jgi:hypothetical protein
MNTQAAAKTVSHDLKIGDKVVVFGRVTTIDADALETIKSANRAFDILSANPRLTENAFEKAAAWADKNG